MALSLAIIKNIYFKKWMLLRNIYDQYDQAENKLTHALISSLYHEPKLIRPFLKWLNIRNIPPLRKISMGLQGLPGQVLTSIPENQNSVPDAYFCNSDSWAIIIESKVQSNISDDQLHRHQKKAKSLGYDDSVVVVISVNPPKKFLSDVTYVTWKKIYQWFSNKINQSFWAKHFVDYLEIYESKMLAQDYNIKGTLTMFSGFHFTNETPYTYREGKRLIQLLGQEFRKCDRLKNNLGFDPQSPGRPAITQGDNGSVWDFISLNKQATDKTYFTCNPHITFSIGPRNVSAAITIPNGIKGQFKSRLKLAGIDGFKNLLAKVEANLRESIIKVPKARPLVYIIQRHYKTQRSSPEKDGLIEVDLRTLVDAGDKELKHQPMWAEAIYEILINKKTNIQFGVESRFPYSEKIMQSTKAIDVMIDAWIAMKPLLLFATR